MTVRELASGIDTLILSGRVQIADALLSDLDRSREIARADSESVPYRLGNVEFGLAPYGWGKYPYHLSHEYGLIGLTGSRHLPAVRVQPKAETLHGLGPKATVEAFADVLSEVGEVGWSVSRVDLFADIQGWFPTVEEREQFVSRAKTRDTYEESDELNGFRFGRGTGGGLMARIYEKTREAAKRGVTWWPAVWGDEFRRGEPVTRIEFQFRRTVLRQCSVDTPDDVLEEAAGLWGYATDWLSFRDRSVDKTKSRWPVSPEWEAIRRVSLRNRPVTVTRTMESRRAADEARIRAGLCGYVSSLAAIRKVDGLEDAIPMVNAVLRQLELETGIPLSQRIAKKRRRLEWGL